MKTSIACGFQLFALAHGATPLSSVLEMLSGMAAKGEQEKHDEITRFTTFKQFCEDTSRDRQHSIKTAAGRITFLTAAIEKDSALMSELGANIDQLTHDIGLWTNDQKVGRRVRNNENADFKATHTDYSESIDALSRAIATLKKQNFDRKQATKALLQVTSLDRVPAEERSRLLALVQGPPANAYEFQSGGVIDMLKELKIKFTAERENLSKDELNEKFAFERMMQDLTNRLGAANEDLDNKQARNQAANARQAQNQRERQMSMDTKAEDEKYLSDLVAECDTKSAEFAARQKTRADELAALQGAMKVLKGDAVSANAAKHLPKLVQVALLQRRSMRASGSQQRVTEFLQGAAQRLSSSALTLAAVRSSEDAFGKVKTMIEDMIIKLKEEASAETEKKAFCDKEVAENKENRKQLGEQSDDLTAQSEQQSAKANKLSELKQELSSQIAELDSSVAQAVQMRADEAKANAQTIADAISGQDGVASAVQILKEFYAKAAESTALIQGAADDTPSTWDTAYTGMQSEKGGVLGMLEVLESDFARLEAETKANEDLAVREQRKFLAESDEDKAVKSANLSNATRELQRTNQRLHAVGKDLKDTQAQLGAAHDTYEKLKPQCLEDGLSYEERVQKRREEIESLKEALKILEGQA